jgi:hypothetical protein
MSDKIDAVQFVMDACEQGVDFGEIDRWLTARGLSIREAVKALREAARRDLTEAEALMRFRGQAEISLTPTRHRPTL